MQGFVDRTVDEIGRAEFASDAARRARRRRLRLTPTPEGATTDEAADVRRDHRRAHRRRHGAAAPACSTRTQVRAAAGLTMALGAVAFVYANFAKVFVPIQVVTTFFFVDFLIRVTVGLKYSPTGVVAGWLTRRQEPQWVSAKPKRFAWTLGLIMSAAMMVITNSDIHGALPRTICLICLALMWLESVLGLCLGCEIHGLPRAARLGDARTTPSRSARTAHATFVPPSDPQHVAGPATSPPATSPVEFGRLRHAGGRTAPAGPSSLGQAMDSWICAALTHSSSLASACS